jgi:pyruvate/2-oxoacid:ferredoxin oxidoreductase beta subunit
MTDDIREEELLSCGHLGCPGCGAALSLRLALKTLGRRTIISLPACCTSAIDGFPPNSSTLVPLFHTAFETAASTAAGIRAGLRAKGVEDVTVVAWAGDGGTFDIGFQALSACAERNEDILYICYDNEAYMNTGIQRSSSTPPHTWTNTTPYPILEATPKKNILEILGGHRIPYLASATPAYPDDFCNKLLKAKNTKGFRFIHIFSFCPPGWKAPEKEGIAIMRAAVESRLFPLYEMENGTRLRITHEPAGLPLAEYVKRQGRFKWLTEEELAEWEKHVDEEWRYLKMREKLSREFNA